MIFDLQQQAERIADASDVGEILRRAIETFPGRICYRCSTLRGVCARKGANVTRALRTFNRGWVESDHDLERANREYQAARMAFHATECTCI